MYHAAVSRLEDMQRKIAAGQKNDVQRKEWNTIGTGCSHWPMIADREKPCFGRENPREEGRRARAGKDTRGYTGSGKIRPSVIPKAVRV
jgi:hypothetical protein